MLKFACPLLSARWPRSADLRAQVPRARALDDALHAGGDQHAASQCTQQSLALLPIVTRANTPQKSSPDANKVFRQRAFAVGFYATWRAACHLARCASYQRSALHCWVRFGLRLGYCPYLLTVFHGELLRWGSTPWDAHYTQVICCHALISSLNYFWTFEMGSKMLLQKQRPKAG